MPASPIHSSARVCYAPRSNFKGAPQQWVPLRKNTLETSTAKMFVRAWRGGVCASARLQETRADKPVHLDTECARPASAAVPRAAATSHWGPHVLCHEWKIKHRCSCRTFKLLITADWARCAQTHPGLALPQRSFYVPYVLLRSGHFSDISNKTSRFTNTTVNNKGNKTNDLMRFFVFFLAREKTFLFSLQ